MTNQVTRPKDDVLVYRNSDSEVLEQRGRYIASRYLEIINYCNLDEGFKHGPQRARVSGQIVISCKQCLQIPGEFHLNGSKDLPVSITRTNGGERSGKHWEHCRMRRKGAEGQTKYRSDGLCTLPRRRVRVPSNKNTAPQDTDEERWAKFAPG
jgi:hypothetical protein